MNKNVENQNPLTVWNTLKDSKDSVLIDVRTKPEWAFVGTPDLTSIRRKIALVEWLEFPFMKQNPNFMEQIEEKFPDGYPSNLYFICRSGSRSLDAANFIQETANKKGLEVKCFNVEEGFEGDLNAQGQRGTVNGWKARELPWRQT